MSLLKKERDDLETSKYFKSCSNNMFRAADRVLKMLDHAIKAEETEREDMRLEALKWLKENEK